MDLSRIYMLSDNMGWAEQSSTVTSNFYIISERQIGKDMEASGRHLTESNIPTFVWRR
jgi:hypothetical protein